MPLISQQIGNLLNGVTQQPISQRPSSQAQVQNNALSSSTRGLRKRPPSKHVAQLVSPTGGPFTLDFSTDFASVGTVPPAYLQSFVHMVNRTATEKYIVVVANGDLNVFDALTGIQETVVFPGGKGYLAGGPYKAVTVGDFTFLVDTMKTVKQGTSRAPAAKYEALLFLRQVDYSTFFSVTLNGVTVAIQTVDAAHASAKASLSTNSVATDLITALTANTQLNGDFNFSQYGSTIYLARKNGQDFTLAAADGLSDKGLRTVKGSVQLIEDLPVNAVPGMVVQISGDATTSKDDYWVIYDTASTAGGQGIWRECPAPGTPLRLDPTTMPWTLERDGYVLKGLKHIGHLPSPVVDVASATTIVDGFTSDPDTSASYDPLKDVTLTEDNTAAKGILLTATGSTRELRITYDMDTTLISPGLSANVTLKVTNPIGGAVIYTQTKSYVSGLMKRNEAFVTQQALPALSIVEVRLHYSFAILAALSRKANLNLHSTVHQVTPGITSVERTTRKITFATTVEHTFGTLNIGVLSTDAIVYPVGTQVSISFLSPVVKDVTCNPTTVNKTPAQLATYVAAIIDADASYAATTDGANGVLVSNQSGAAPAPTFSVTMNLNGATTMWSLDLSAADGSLVGYTAFNRTDGSHGVITGNGADYLVVAGALSGGSNNSFNPGDVVDVQVADGTFVFQPFAWNARVCGDLTSVPMPSFVNRSISEVFFFQGRLGFTAEENVVLSEQGNLPNFFRSTATDLLASDVIDIKSAGQGVALFDNAVVWGPQLWLTSSSGYQYALTGEPVLSPSTVQLVHMGSYPCANVRPLTIGKRIVFPRVVSGYTRLLEGIIDFTGRLVAPDITQHVPEYIPGVPLAITGDAGQEFIAVLTDGARDSLWVHKYHYELQPGIYGGDQKVQASWSKWRFPGAQIVSLDMIDSVLSMLVIRSDGMFLETVDIGTLPDPASDHRDRQGWGTPVDYTFRYQLSPIYKRNERDESNTRGRLQLRYIDIAYDESCNFSVNVTAVGRPTITYVFTSPVAAAGTFRVPIQTRNDAIIEIVNSAPACCSFSNIDWEGQYDIRSQPL